jgi:hypothetical protein
MKGAHQARLVCRQATDRGSEAGTGRHKMGHDSIIQEIDAELFTRDRGSGILPGHALP